MGSEQLIVSPPGSGVQPINGLLHSGGPPPFLNKTYDMVDDPSTDAVVSWSSARNSFVVWNPPEFARDLLPKYFKHNNFSSFVRQLNTYGFRKVDPDRWEFANEGFLRGERHLLKNIHRRKPVSHSQATPHQGLGGQSQSSTTTLEPYVEAGKFGLEGEVERLKRDKNVLMMELVRLRQQQQATEKELRLRGQRLQVTEQRQQQMMTFLTKAMQNPSFLAQVVQQNEASKRLVAATDRKRRRLPKQEEEEEEDDFGISGTTNSEGQIVRYQPNPSSNDSNTRLLQLFHNNTNKNNSNRTDLSSVTEATTNNGSSFEALFRDNKGSGPAAAQEGSGAQDGDRLRRNSSVTLTEMEMHVPLVGDGFSGGAPGTLSPPSPLNVPRMRMGPGNMTGDGVPPSVGARILDDSGERESSGESMSIDGTGTTTTTMGTTFVSPVALEGKPISVGDGAFVGPGANDVFWEQFLSGNPDSSEDTGTEETQDRENHAVDDGEVEASERSVQMWRRGREKPSVDRLAEQMGQLAPGLKL